MLRTTPLVVNYLVIVSESFGFTARMITGIVAIQIAFAACFQSDVEKSIGDLPSETIAVIATARNDRAYEASAALFIFMVSLIWLV